MITIQHIKYGDRENFIVIFFLFVPPSCYYSSISISLSSKKISKDIDLIRGTSYFSYSPSYICCCILNFSFLFFIESSWTSSPPRPPSPQSQTSFDTLSRNPNFFENSKKKRKKNANDLTNLN